MLKQVASVDTSEEELDAAFEVALLDFDEDGVAGFGLIELEPNADFSGFDPIDDFIVGNSFRGQLPTTLAGTLVC